MKFRSIAVRTAVALSVVAGVTGTAGTAAAQDQTPGDILQENVQRVQSEHKLPGMIGMLRNGDAIDFAHAGESDMFQHVEADPRATYRIGSNTKQFVSTVLLQLEAEHKLSLDDSVDRWLPGAVNKNGNDGTKITIRSLLNHTSRLPDYIKDPKFSAEYAADVNPDRRWDPQELVNIATSKQPLDKFDYSNTNYMLAGMTIKAVTGNDVANEVTKRLIEPLNLKNTTFPTTDSKLYGNFMHGYETVRDVSFSNVQATGPAGAMVSTMEDLANFDRALLSGKLLPPEQQRELTTPGDYAPHALGVGRVETDCGTGFTHSGEVLGYTNTWITSPDGQRQVVVADNEYHLTDTGTIAAQWKAAVNAYCATGK